MFKIYSLRGAWPDLDGEWQLNLLAPADSEIHLPEKEVSNPLLPPNAMVTSSRSSSASRSRSPRDLTGRVSQNIPEMFRTQASNMATSRGLLHTPSLLSNPDSQIPSETAWIVLSPQPPPSLHDLHSVATDIKNTLTAALTAAISDLKIDIQAITGRVHKVEKTTATHTSVLRRSCQVIDTHTLQLSDLNRHVEDLDNHGRRHNLRIRGLPESVDADHLQTEVTGLFNTLLGKPATTYIGMERIHRALHPRGRDSDPPRDIVCCVIDYQLKEEILRNARTNAPLTHNGTEIRLFQDLSTITLQRRRELRPLLEILRTNGIPYRWKFPFGLSASNQGRSALLRVPEDLHHFCETLDIPYMEVPEWYSEYRPPANKASARNEPMETQAHHFRRQRSPSDPRERH